MVRTSPLLVQVRVIHALLIREMLTRFGRHNIGFLWLFVEPMLFTLGVTALWNFIGLHRSSTIPITAFAITGYSSVLLWRNMPTRCVGSIEPNIGLMYHRQVKVLDIFLSRVLLEGCGATISFIVLSLFFIAGGWIKPPEDLSLVCLGWLMTAWFGVSLALLLGALAARSELVDKLWHPAAYLLFPLSGAAFSVDAMPQKFRDVVLWLPMVHGVELVRDGYFGSVMHTHYNVWYMASVCIVLTAFALAQERIVSRNLVLG